MAKNKKSAQIAQNPDLLKVTHAILLDATCTYSFSVRLENGDTDIITNECGRPFHNDLKVAFEKFDAHLAVILEQVPADQVADIDDSVGINKDVTDNLLRHKVNDVKFYGTMTDGSVVLSGIKILKTNDEVKLKTPKQALDDNEYDFVSELAAAAMDLVSEISQYHHGKQRPEQQLDMIKQDEEENA